MIFSLIDRLVIQADRALKTVVPFSNQASHSAPLATEMTDHALTPAEMKHAAGLMRVNHTGEVCAQALYQGQALTAKLPTVRLQMEQAADEEIDHLVWCEQRLATLNSQTSVLNPVWYLMSYSLGAISGVIGDKWSLGFVAATEELVGKHLVSHLTSLPEHDLQSRAIVAQMIIDEQSHAEHALASGGYPYPAPIKKGMEFTAKIMTTSSYYI